jgi:TolA-binding protein
VSGWRTVAPLAAALSAGMLAPYSEAAPDPQVNVQQGVGVGGSVYDSLIINTYGPTLGQIVKAITTLVNKAILNASFQVPPYNRPNSSVQNELGSPALRDAISLLNQGDYRAAEDSARVALNRAKGGRERSEVTFVLAQAFVGNGNIEGAARAYGDTYHSYPQGPHGAESLLMQASTFAHLSRYNTACEVLAEFRENFSALTDLDKYARGVSQTAKCNQ